MGNDPSVPAAFIAGLLSFLSPCVLPLVSSWLVFISGGQKAELDTATDSPAHKAEQNGWRIRLIVSTVSFILGFTVVFIVLSLLFSSFFLLLGNLANIINIIAGSIIILFGFNILFNFIPFLNYEKRVHPLKRPQTFLGSFAVGLAFGAGWTPCIGPILGSILLMAGQSGKLLLSAACLVSYSAGLGVPFLVVSLFWGGLLKYLEKLRAWTKVMQRISGIFLIAIGLFMMLGRFKTLTPFFLKQGYAIAAWTQNGGLAIRLVPAIVFLAIALFPIIIKLIKQKYIFSPGTLVFSGIFLALTILQAAGIINCLDLVSRWMSYIGV
jgi:cytochrome c-type biogenesis protein